MLVNEAGNKLTVIDFPQCVSINHPNARTYFDRDVQCIYTYFDKMAHKSHDDSTDGKILDVSEYPLPNIDDIVVEKRLDH